MKLGKHLFKLFTAGCMFLSLAACSNAPAQNSTEESWDREVDFLVVGYGLAGEAGSLESKRHRSKR